MRNRTNRPEKWNRRVILAAGALTVPIALLPPTAARAQTGYASRVIMTGLNNPRGLNFNPVNGGLYVAEAGIGGNGASIVSPEGGTESYGATGSVTQYLNGVQSRVVTGLPSLANQSGATPGGSAVGFTDIAFTSTGAAYGIIGLGGSTAERTTLTNGGAPGNLFGQMVQLSITGNTFSPFADLTLYEKNNNPDGGTLTGGAADTDSNPYGLTATPSGFAVVDAGANDMLRITSTGTISTGAVFAPLTNNTGIGGPTYQAVPTSVTAAPDGTLFVGSLTGFPFPQGGASLYKVAPGGGVTSFTGFTTIIDVAYANNFLYVLQYSTSTIAGPPSAGQLLRVDPTTGTKTLLLSDPLLTPGGLAVAPNGSFYITNLSTSAGSGQVIQVFATPEPGAAGLLASGGAILGGGILPRLRRRRRG